MLERFGSGRGPGGRRRAFFVTGATERGWAARAASVLAGLGLAAALACAGPGPRPEPAPEPPATDARAAAAALQAAEALHREGEHRAAARTADSLHRAWREDRGLTSAANRALWLQGRALEALGELADAGRAYESLLERLGEGAVRDAAVRRLAGVRLATGDPAAAAHWLLETPSAVGEEERALLREAAPELEDAALRRLVEDHPPVRPGAAALHVERARRLALEGRRGEAERIARDVLAASPPEEEARVARALLAAGAGEAVALRVGAVLPLSGRFSGVGGLLREGMELALEEFRAATGGRVPVEIVFADDRSDPERSVALIRELEARGVVAILGPVRSESFAGGARARRNPRLALVSPTATEVLAPAPHAYTLWSRERRERDVGADVGRWVVRRLGLRRAAVLHPEGEGGRWAADAFARSVLEAGGELVRSAAYATGATTFEGPIGEIAAAEPEVVFVAAETAPTVLQIAPQLPYYGVSTAVVAGGPIWSDPAVVRRLEPPAADFRVVGTFVDRLETGSAWDRFQTAYEVEYSKPLRENMLPALAYDAAGLVFAAAAAARLPLPEAVADALARLPERPGATGFLRVDPATSTVARRTLIRMLLERSLVEADPGRILEWLEEARLAAEREAEEPEGRP